LAAASLDLETRCVRCDDLLGEGRFRCRCGALGELRPDLAELDGPSLRASFRARRGARTGVDTSGVWRFRELVMPRIPMHSIVTRREGNTGLYRPPALVRYLGRGALSIKHEGENPTGSFKDRGMTVGVTRAILDGARAVACASTGNTSASLAAYAAYAGLPAVVFVPADKISHSKLVQTLAYGALVLGVEGDFDDAMVLVERASRELGLTLLNSINPWRIEGQKTIIFELLEELDWKVPDWIVFPAGNLGNTSAFGKALRELYELGLIDRLPRLVAVQAEGAAPFVKLFEARESSPHAEFQAVKAETVASAIRIGRPVSWEKAIREITATDGLVVSVSDQEIMEAKARIDQAGVGCEPASAAALAGAKRLADEDIIGEHEHVVLILTGHLLKDSATTLAYHEGKLGYTPQSARRIHPISLELDSIAQAIDAHIAETAHGSEG